MRHRATIETGCDRLLTRNKGATKPVEVMQSGPQNERSQAGTEEPGCVRSRNGIYGWLHAPGERIVPRKAGGLGGDAPRFIAAAYQQSEAEVFWVLSNRLAEEEISWLFVTSCEERSRL